VLPGERTITVRGLADWEMEAVQLALPRPNPPRIRNAEDGSTVEDETDPKYKERVRLWTRQVQRAEVAIACDLETMDGQSFRRCENTDERAAFFKAAIDEIERALTAAEVVTLFETSRSLAAPALLIEAARSLIVEASGGKGYSPPEKYAMTEEELELRACALFSGCNPFKWKEECRFTAPQWAVIMAHTQHHLWEQSQRLV